MFHELETQRLHLRNISIEDRAFIYEQFSNEEVTRFLFDEEPLTGVGGADRIISMYLAPEPRSCHRWVLARKDDGTKIGTCGYHVWDRAQDSVQLGYDLQKPYWGHGYMREALGAILCFDFDEMAVRRVEAHIYMGNQRSISLAKRMGFVDSGRDEIVRFSDEEYVHHIYVLSRDAFQDVFPKQA